MELDSSQMLPVWFNLGTLDDIDLNPDGNISFLCDGQETASSDGFGVIALGDKISATKYIKYLDPKNLKYPITDGEGK